MPDPGVATRLTALRAKLQGGRTNDALWSGIGTIGGAAAVLVSLAILTAVLDADQFGVYSGVAAAGAVLLGFAVLGAPEAMLLALPRDEGLPDHRARVWGRGMGTMLMAASVCWAVLMVATRFVLPDVDPMLIATLVAGEYISSGVGVVNVQLLRGIGRFKQAAMVSLVTFLARPLAALSLLVGGEPSLLRYATFNLASAVVFAVGTTVFVARIVGRPRLSLSRRGVDYRQGGAIAIGQTSSSVSAGIDQTLLLRAGFETDNGIYGVGVRIVNYSLLPASAVMTTIYPEFFDKGVDGIEATVAFARRMAKPLVAYGLVILPPIWIGALVVEYLLGRDYDGVALVIWTMSGFPVLRIIQALVGDALKGVGRFAAASSAIAATALLNVGLNLWLIPTYSWRGAAAATYVSEIVYLGLLFLALRRARRLG